MTIVIGVGAGYQSRNVDGFLHRIDRYRVRGCVVPEIIRCLLLAGRIKVVGSPLMRSQDTHVEEPIISDMTRAIGHLCQLFCDGTDRVLRLPDTTVTMACSPTVSAAIKTAKSIHLVIVTFHPSGAIMDLVGRGQGNSFSSTAKNRRTRRPRHQLDHRVHQ